MNFNSLLSMKLVGLNMFLHSIYRDNNIHNEVVYSDN